VAREVGDVSGITAHCSLMWYRDYQVVEVGMVETTVIYKCRRCGEEFEDGHKAFLHRMDCGLPVMDLIVIPRPTMIARQMRELSEREDQCIAA
jgi:DNA-directed RNA polymerase subunit RPC12/RpoP